MSLKKRDLKLDAKMANLLQTPSKRPQSLRDQLQISGNSKSRDFNGSDVKTPKFKSSEMPILRGQYSSNKDEIPQSLKKRKVESQQFLPLDFTKMSDVCISAKSRTKNSTLAIPSSIQN